VTFPSHETRRRAEWLVRCYPRDWRSRYGDEFTELLVSEMSEQPRSWRRSMDVVWSGLVARLSEAGLGGRRLEPVDQVRRCLVTLGCALAVFLAFGIAIWAQLTIGWQWSEPNTATTSVAMIVMSSAVLAFLALAVAAAIPIAWNVLGRAARREAAGLLRPSLLFFAGLSLLIIGGRHFGNGWPGTGGHPWAHQGIVPGGVAAFTWASTLSVTSYWVHPGALMAFPASEIDWMVVSPIAMVGLAIGAAKVVRRVDLPPRTLHYEARLAHVAAVLMTVFLSGAFTWVVYGGPGPRNLFHVGTIDVAGLLVMAVALVVAGRAVQQASHSRLVVSAR
jgi:hypothetical protein